MNDDNVKTIECPPDYEGMRRWLLAMYKTDPEKAKDIAETMGSEAPKFPKRVVISIKANDGYGVDQPETTLTLGELRDLIDDAAEYYGEDCIVVTHDSANRYGASYGKIYKSEIISEDEWGEDE